MKILYCNKYNYPFSGTESYLFDLIRRMDERGHRTALFSMDHGQPAAFSGRGYLIPYLNFKDPHAGWLKKSRMAVHALYSRSARRHMRDCLHDYSPDIAHIRGIYHHLSPSILWELRQHGVPVLYHLNDFKLLCPTYNLVAKGQPCEVCSGGDFYHAVTQNCYSGPRSAAAVLAGEAYLHKWLRTYEQCVDLFLAPSEFVRNKLIASGIPSRRIEVLRHFQKLLPPNRLIPDEGYILYFGRLSPEKGVDELLHAMVRVPHIPLVIAGDGPERKRLEALSHNLNLTQVLFAGTVRDAQLDKLIAASTFTVFPSRAYETLGKSILESYAWGRPVVASDLGSRRELVEHGVTGLLYPPGDRDKLAAAIEALYDCAGVAASMGAAARRRIQRNHDPDHHLDALLEIYSRLARSPSLPAPNKVVSFAEPLPSTPHRAVRVAFIGGRGVISKYSGIESFYEQAGAELARLGHQVTVYCRTYFTPRGPVHNGMSVLRLPTIRTKHLETVVHTALSTLHAMFSRCDVVHYHCLGPALFSFLPRLTGKKTVVTVQGLDWQRRKWGRIAARILRWGESAAVMSPNATTVVSKTLQHYYWERYRSRTYYIPNGASAIVRRDPRRLADWGLLPDNYVLFLGRFSPEKNCDLLIAAFEDVATDMKLVLAGGSSHSDAYADSLRRHQSDRVTILPWVSGDDLDELLSNSALFVLPSDLEGLSLALLDAMAAGVCVLTSDIPENSEVVSGVGFTFRSRDQQDLTRVLDVLVHNPGLRHQMALRARERIDEQYRWPTIARSLESVYYEVLGCKPAEQAQPLKEAPAFLGENLEPPSPQTEVATEPGARAV